jgi:hypothetical protein
MFYSDACAIARLSSKGLFDDLSKMESALITLMQRFNINTGDMGEIISLHQRIMQLRAESN